MNDLPANATQVLQSLTLNITSDPQCEQHIELDSNETCESRHFLHLNIKHLSFIDTLTPSYQHSILIQTSTNDIDEHPTIQSSINQLMIRRVEFTNLNCASSDLFTLAALHNRSATADARGQNRGSKFVPSTNSPHIHASPPRIRFLSSSVPMKRPSPSRQMSDYYQFIVPVNFSSGSI